MRVLFRADGGSAIGWGHVSRCAALAAALEARGVTVTWACREEPGLANLTGRAPDVSIPGEPSFDALPLSEVGQIIASGVRFDWIVVDHYGAQTDYLRELSVQTGARVLLMDDHQVRQGADLRLAPVQGPATDTLSGPEFLLMRDCFEPARFPPSSMREGLLICFGGADHAKDTRGALEALASASTRPTPITVIASDTLADRQALDGLIGELGSDVQRLAWIDGAEMAKRFSATASALVSSSVLAFEALAMGAPVVAIERVDNQRNHAATLRRLGVHSVQEIEEAVGLVLSQEAVALPLGQIDALGAGRVAAHMLGEEESGR